MRGVLSMKEGMRIMAMERKEKEGSEGEGKVD